MQRRLAFDELRQRRDRTIQDARHDAYRSRRKPGEPTVCPQCGATFHKGRWSWAPRPPQARERLCPACRRINDADPGGLVTMRGAFLRGHKEELLGLVQNEAAAAMAEHALSRIMTIAEQNGDVVVATTDTHLAQRIGEALHHAYQGDLAIQYSKGQQFIRVTWQRR
jgi:hypothetical protein